MGRKHIIIAYTIKNARLSFQSNPKKIVININSTMSLISKIRQNFNLINA